MAPLDADDEWTFSCPTLADVSVDVADLVRKALGFDAIRSGVAATIRDTKRREFYSLGVVLGSSYASSPLLPREQPAPAAAGSADEYLPRARPGCLAPHFWLAEGRLPGASLYDHFATSGFTLLVTTQASAPTADTVAQTAAKETSNAEIRTATVPGFTGYASNRATVGKMRCAGAKPQ